MTLNTLWSTVIAFSTISSYTCVHMYIHAITYTAYSWHFGEQHCLLYKSGVFTKSIFHELNLSCLVANCTVRGTNKTLYATCSVCACVHVHTFDYIHSLEAFFLFHLVTYIDGDNIMPLYRINCTCTWQAKHARAYMHACNLHIHTYIYVTYPHVC